MRALKGMMFVAGLFLVLHETDAREWVSRDGRFTVEAELVTVEADQAVLRREDGALVKVPVARLSLADVKFVQDARQAAGLKPAPIVPAENPEPQGPPPARPEVSQWQATPDPALPGFDPATLTRVEIPIPVAYYRPFVLYPTSPSPFVLLGSAENQGARLLWDMRIRKAVGKIEGELDNDHPLALSPDGRSLAYFTVAPRCEIHIWSFPTGKVVQTILVSQEFSVVMFLAFAGPDRIVASVGFEDEYRVYDVKSGKPCGTIHVQPNSERACQTVSPGGNYLAVHLPADERSLAVYDTRNGVRAGRLKPEIASHIKPECLSFSPDGRELAAYYCYPSKNLIQVWDMTSGETTATHWLPDSQVDELSEVSYYGDELQWLADRSGWLLSGVAVVDRESGRFVWHDQDAMNERNVLPRRVVDTNRMLAFRKARGTETLCLVPMPKETIAKARSIVAAGGVAADAGLPPTIETNSKGVKELALVPGPWEYRAAASALPPNTRLRETLPLGTGLVESHLACFSQPAAARLAIGMKTEPSSTAPSACKLYDLQSGKQIAQFVSPFPSEFVDLSPDGRFGLFRIQREKDRLDIWDLESGEHKLAFRPFKGDSEKQRQVEAARFVDENHLVAFSEARELVGWELPECRAVYRIPPDDHRLAGTTRNRRTLVVVSRNTPYLVEALSGRTLGTLPEVESDEPLASPTASFSADENRLAILFFRKEGCLLAAWDLAGGTMLLNLKLPYRAFGLVWCGSQHVLIDTSFGAEHPDTLIDVDRRLVVWNYRLADGAGLWTSPDNRWWAVGQRGSSTVNELFSMELPDQQVGAILAQVRPPQPLIGPNCAVTVQPQIENPPQSLPPGWAQLQNLNEALYRHFSKQLTDRRVQVVDRAGVRLIVGVDENKLEATVPMGGLLTPSRKMLISAKLLTPYLAVVDADGNRLWLKQPSEDDLPPIDPDDCPEGMDKATYVTLQQWDNAVQWLRTTEVPFPLFPPSVHRGYGESLVTPGKSEIRRSPPPAQMQPPGKTAEVCRRVVRQAG